MEYQELVILNRDFRDYTSNLMNSNYENASVNLIRFMNFVEENAIIHDIVHDVVDTTEFDFKECFIMDAGSLQMKNNRLKQFTIICGISLRIKKEMWSFKR